MANAIMGNLLFEMEQLDEALIYFEKTLQLPNVNNAVKIKALVGRANTYFEKGMSD